MTSLRYSLICLLLATAPILACQPPRGEVADTANAQEPGWDAAAIERVLQKLGYRVQKEGSLQQPFMSVDGTLLILHSDSASASAGTAQTPLAEVQLFTYTDHVARARDTDKLDPVRVAPPTMMISWRRPVALAVRNNIAAIILADDVKTRDRIREALESR